MQTLVVSLFLIAVSLGLYLVYISVRHRRGSFKLGLLHAALAISGLCTLFYAIYEGPTSKANNFSALFLLMALIGGILVLLLREKGKPPSMTMVTAHAIFGVIGVSILSYQLLAG